MTATFALARAGGNTLQESFYNKIYALLDSQGAVKPELVLRGQVPLTALASPMLTIIRVTSIMLAEY